MPDSPNGTDRMKFSDVEFKVSNFLRAGDYEHATGTGGRRRTSLTGSQCSEDGLDKQETRRGMRGTSCRWDAASIGKSQTTQNSTLHTSFFSCLRACVIICHTTLAQVSVRVISSMSHALVCLISLRPS